MEINTVLMWIAICAALYVIGSMLTKKQKPKQDDSESAPYKVEPPVESTVEPTVEPPVEPKSEPDVMPVVESKPELKVVNGARSTRKPRVRKSPAKRVAEKASVATVVQTPVQKPKTPRKPQASK
jgi:hypothetical protein